MSFARVRLAELFLDSISYSLVLLVAQSTRTPIMQPVNDTSCVEGRDMLRRRTPTLVLNVNAAKRHVIRKDRSMLRVSGLGRVGCSGTGNVAALLLHRSASAEEVGITVS